MGDGFTIIGDVVGSRDLPDRAGAQRAIGVALVEVSAILEPQQPLEATVGDEFQAVCDTLAEAALLTVLIRLALLPGIDVRCGIGFGQFTVHDADRQPLLQDGPGWWAARSALDSLGGRSSARTARTAYAGPEGSDAAATNAFLLTRDALVDRLGDRGRRILARSLRGETQTSIATAEGVTKSAVSQQFSHGVRAIRDAHVRLSQAGSGP